jgi:hypothetical protein
VTWPLPLLVEDPDAPGTLFLLAGYLLVSVLLMRRDLLLGAYTALAVVMAPLVAAAARPAFVAGVTVVGGVAVLVVRGAPARVRVALRWALLAWAVAEVAYQVGQAAGVDPLWPGRPYTDGRFPGTFGHATWLGAFLAIVGPLAPLWLAPVLLVGLWLAQAKLGLLAFAAGWGWRMRTGGGRQIAVLGAVAGLWLLWSQSKDSWHARTAVWRLGASTWLDQAPWLGFGPGTWWGAVPALQERHGILPAEHFRKAHNEYLQVAFEGGLVALALVLGWIWLHRDAFTGPAGGALVALAVVALGFFPFRVATVATAAVVAMGLATAEEGRA